MNQGFPRLLGDIGGTNARWAWQASSGAELEDISIQPCGASASLELSAKAYLNSHGRPQPLWAGIGVATAITGDEVRMTNNDWRFSISAFQQSLGLERCLVVNDFTSLALSLPALKATDLRAIGGGVAVSDRSFALIGPGTGLGVSGLIADGKGHFTALSGEGGHVTLAASDEGEAALLGALRSAFDHVSAERVLSGQGLVNLYHAVCTVEGVAPQALGPVDVTNAAIAKTDAHCVAAVEYFTRFLGNVAGNLTLTLGALGGLYIGGGIVPRLGLAFDEVLFRQQFEAKGRYQAMLQDVPVWLITASTPALLGASRALDVLP